MDELKSYFIRHTRKILVSTDVIKKIFDENKVAIHFPGSGKQDSKSIKLKDYDKPGERRAIKCFKELSENGGYIWAEYYTCPEEVKVGKIKPKSAVEYVETIWSEDCKNPERKKGERAILKTLQMENVTTLKKGEVMELVAARPRMCTITEWKIIRDRLKYYVKGIPIPESWNSLTTEQQEAVCAEYLRNPNIENCPKLDFLLLPVGRTLQDVDIYGCASDGKKIFAQVTYENIESKNCKQKLENLKFGGKENHLILFCNCGNEDEKDDVLIIPVKRVVFEWLKNNKKFFDSTFHHQD
jgi:hypothetical protein